MGWYFPSKIVGIYTSSIKVSEFLIIFPTGISLALLPMFSKNILDKEKLKTTLEFSLRLTYILILPITFGGIIISENLINFIFGEEYLSSHYAFKILIPSLIATSIFMLLSQLLIALNKRKELLLYEFFIFVINLIGNIILIPSLSFIGAAYMTTLSNFLGMVLIILIVSKYLDFDVYFGIKKPLLASILMSLILLVLNKINFLLAIIIGCIFYFIVLILIKEELITKVIKNIMTIANLKKYDN